jgi:hypothetical protein
VASGPWFFSKKVTVKGNPNIGKDHKVAFEVTDIRLTPPFPIPPDPPISANSWVWAAITELGSDGKPNWGDATMWVANTIPQDDKSIVIKVCSTWPDDLPGQLKLLFWSSA